ncbi:MAG: hypothetical protein ACKPKO_20275, partial [Candidatus Fonsibacter sp.]
YLQRRATSSKGASRYSFIVNALHCYESESYVHVCSKANTLVGAKKLHPTAGINKAMLVNGQRRTASRYQRRTQVV